MVVIEVFTPVVQRILKHNMVSNWTAASGLVWPALVSGAEALCSLFSRAVFFFTKAGRGRGFHTAWSPLLGHRRYSALRDVASDSSLLKDGQAVTSFWRVGWRGVRAASVGKA